MQFLETQRVHLMISRSKNKFKNSHYETKKTTLSERFI